MKHENLPDGVPIELEWLFTEEQPGRRIGYSFRCPYGEAIHRYHGPGKPSELDAVVQYQRALRIYLQDGARAPRTSKLGAKRVLTLKNKMVKAIVRHYGGLELGSKDWQRWRIMQLEQSLAQVLDERARDAVERAKHADG